MSRPIAPQKLSRLACLATWDSIHSCCDFMNDRSLSGGPEAPYS
jgi:hypothetical protein